MTVISIHQPSYWPWLGLCDKVARSDIFVVLDNVDLNKEAYQHRNIFLFQGKKKMITIPLSYSLGTKIKNIKVSHLNWKKDHLEKFKNWYKKAPFFEYYWPFIEEIYSNNSNHLVSHVFKTMKFSFKELGITTKIVCASELEVQGTKSDLVLDICKKNNAKIYLTGNGFFNYLPANGKEIFSQGGVSIVLQQFSHPTYTQVGKNDFVAGLGILDLLFNEGPIKAKEIFWRNIQKDNREDYEL